MERPGDRVPRARFTSLQTESFWHRLGAGKWIILSCAVALGTIPLIYGLIQPPYYTATAKIDIEAPSSPAPLAQGYSGVPSYQAYLNTQLEILKSRTLSELVATRLRAERPTDYQTLPRESLAEKIQQGLDIQLAPNTSLVLIRVTSSKPPEAALWANHLAEVYIQENESKISTAVRQRVASLLQGAEAGPTVQVGGGGEENGQQGKGGEQLAKANEELDRAVSKRRAIESKKSILEQSLQANEAGTSVQSSLISPVVQSLIQARTRFESERQTLIRQQGSQSSEVQEKEKDISRFKMLINEELRFDIQRAESELSEAWASERDAREFLNRLKRKASVGDARRAQGIAPPMNPDPLLQGLPQKDWLRAFVSELRSSNISIVEQATSPVVPTGRFNLVHIVLGLSGGLFLGVLVVLVRGRLDRTIRSENDLESFLDLPQMAVIPRTREFGSSVAREAFISLRAALLFARRDRRSQVILVTSSVSQEGKSTVAVHLGEALADAGESTLLVDLDLRRPSLHRQLILSNEPGFTDLMSRPEAVNVNRIVRRTARRNLSVITAGALSHPVQAYLSERFVEDWFEQFRSVFRWIIVDSPSLASVSDGLILSSYVEGVVFVVRADRTDKRLARQCVRNLQRVNPHVIGAVLNDFDFEKHPGVKFQY